MRFDIITIFPEMFQALDYGIVRRAKQNNLVDIQLWNPRDFANDLHKTVDDRPYGGGPGMLMKAQPLLATIKAVKNASPEEALVVYLSPQGRLLKQADVVRFSQQKRLILLAGRYEGIDERILDQAVDTCWSIGDYVVSGGELPCMVLTDAIIRLLPGCLGHPASAWQESFTNGLLESPHYTRPENLDGEKVPEVLLSGNHKAIARWRIKQSLGKTWLIRPDLLAQKSLNPEEKQLLDEFMQEIANKKQSKAV